MTPESEWDGERYNWFYGRPDRQCHPFDLINIGMDPAKRLDPLKWMSGQWFWRLPGMQHGALQS